MSIRLKIVLAVLPLLIVTILLVGITSAFSARAGITRIAVEALGFKAQEFQKYAQSQWDLLVQNRLAEDPSYLSVTQRALESYAETLIRGDTELIFAVDSLGRLVMSTTEIDLTDQAETDALAGRASGSQIGWQQIDVDGIERVGQALIFEPFGWYVLVTDTRENFYSDVDQIFVTTYYILGGSIAFAAIFLYLFAQILTGPLSRMVRTMLSITKTNDLSERVPVEYRDEIGAMSRTFNKMLVKLESADQQIRGFALRSVVAERNERKIRNIFQKYVPKNVIDSIFEDPTSALEGSIGRVAVLFTDIRSFTTLSEGFMPDELVQTLNAYFEPLIDIIMGHGGVVDKFIGDALMAFFGAPNPRPDDAVHAVLAATEMQKAIADFNEKQFEIGKPVFKTGIGVNYGGVTVGNMGSEKKMDFTIIGDQVNYGSRLEGLTKEYRQDVIVSRSVFAKVKDRVPTRFLGFVQPKGKTEGEPIYTVALDLTPTQKDGWKFYHDGIRLYYSRKFERARSYFKKTIELLPSDWLARDFLRRAEEFIQNPPPASWNGVDVMTTK